MNKFVGISILAVVMGSTAALAQTSPSAQAPTNAPPAVSTTTMSKEGLTLTDAQAKAWIKKSVHSSDGKNVGEVTALKRDASGHVTAMQVGTGGFLGMGETLVDVAPAQLTLESDRVLLSLTAEQVKALPKSKQ